MTLDGGQLKTVEGNTSTRCTVTVYYLDSITTYVTTVGRNMGICDMARQGLTNMTETCSSIGGCRREENAQSLADILGGAYATAANQPIGSGR